MIHIDLKVIAEKLWIFSGQNNIHVDNDTITALITSDQTFMALFKSQFSLPFSGNRTWWQSFQDEVRQIEVIHILTMSSSVLTSYYKTVPTYEIINTASLSLAYTVKRNNYNYNIIY